jgi:hypothetical protein
MNDKEELELEVRRILANEVEGHRNFLQSQFRNLTWGLGILFTVASIIFVFIFGKSIDESKATLISTIDSKVVDYRIVESFKDKLNEFINIAVEGAVDDDNTTKKINLKVNELAKNSLLSVTTDIENKLLATVNEQIIKSTNLNASEIIGKVSMPSGAVIAFNKTKCPIGWTEYMPAQGRFIRGIDKSGNRADPDGERLPGNLQDDSLNEHSHGGVISTSIGNDGKENRSYIDAGDGNIGRSTFNATGNNTLSHTKTFGGSETRPLNVALLYCVKT